jgi:hypothetical protein
MERSGWREINEEKWMNKDRWRGINEEIWMERVGWMKGDEWREAD